VPPRIAQQLGFGHHQARISGSVLRARRRQAFARLVELVLAQQDLRRAHPCLHQVFAGRNLVIPADGLIEALGLLGDLPQVETRRIHVAAADFDIALELLFGFGWRR
jgi:hypothetical protein